MLKLSILQPGPTLREIRLDGRLDASTVPHLIAALDECRAGPDQTISLDLGGLTSVDADGRGFLIALRADGWGRAGGCRLRGGSLYISALLEESRS